MVTLCPTCGAAPRQDGRAVCWRVRIRLYSDNETDEPIADSDPELPADAPGESLIYSLSAVAEHLTAVAAAFHDAPCSGLEHTTLVNKLKSLRVALSRRANGTAAWRVPYEANDAPYRARVDIVRARARGGQGLSDANDRGSRRAALGSE